MSHTHANLYVHLVWGTKYRKPFIRKQYTNRFHKYITGIINNVGAHVIAIGGMPDHIHVLVKILPRLSVAELMKRIKINSSIFFKRDLDDQVKFSWQEGYGAFSVSESVVKKVIAYIENQEEHHKKRDFAEEFAALLKRHGL